MGYFLPKKFGFDCRKTHLSSLIWSGQISRETAMKKMLADDYSLELQEQDRQYVIKKLGITEEEFERIMDLPPKKFWDYPSCKKALRKYKYNYFLSIYSFLKHFCKRI
jgi:hypothetical protein